jgi:hypothetical protein
MSADATAHVESPAQTPQHVRDDSGETASVKRPKPRVGVFICHCGINIAKTVDVKRVAEEIAKEAGVVTAEDYQYVCSVHISARLPTFASIVPGCMRTASRQRKRQSILSG